MGFFSTLSTLLDEDSDQSLEKRLTGAIDNVERKLNNGLDRAENGVKKVDDLGRKLDANAQKMSSAIDKVDDIANKSLKSDK